MDDVLDKLEDLHLSTGSANGGKPNLGSLDTKLKLMILKSVPDMQSLKALVQSSPDYCGVFLSKRHEILSSVAGLVEIHPEVLTEALAVRDASLMIRPGYGAAWKAEVEEHIQRYEATRATPVPAFRYANTVDSLNAFHAVVLDLTHHFTSNALSARPVTREPAQNAGEEDISKEETRRIHRAFYRYELFLKSFANSSLPTDYTNLSEIQMSTFTSMEMAKIFFSMFELWEVEEIACIQNYAWKIYAEALKTYATELLPKDVSPQGGYFSANIDHYLNLGLNFLHQYLNSSTSDAKLELLRANLQYGWRSIVPALNIESPHTLYCTDHFLEKEDSTITFNNDDASGPNAAWVWSTGGMYEFDYNKTENHIKRGWGYVFWDKKRLDAWGLLNGDPVEDVKGMDTVSFKMYCQCF